ncbi:MAG TPA: hypothetical protein PLD54_00565 [Candidatus Levybacteria bacterium]|nr:hypothetical protein [Candidatus Levybacteria bacterium]
MVESRALAIIPDDTGNEKEEIDVLVSEWPIQRCVNHQRSPIVVPIEEVFEIVEVSAQDSFVSEYTRFSQQPSIPLTVSEPPDLDFLQRTRISVGGVKERVITTTTTFLKK